MGPVIPLLGAGLGAVLAPATATALGITSAVGIGALTAGMATAGQTLFGAVTGKKPGLDTLLTGAMAGITGGASSALSGAGKAAEGAARATQAASDAAGVAASGVPNTAITAHQQALLAAAKEAPLSAISSTGAAAANRIAPAMGNGLANRGVPAVVDAPAVSQAPDYITKTVGGFEQTVNPTTGEILTSKPVSATMGGGGSSTDMAALITKALQPERWQDVAKKSLITGGIGTGLQTAAGVLLRPEPPEPPRYGGTFAPGRGNATAADFVQGRPNSLRDRLARNQARLARRKAGMRNQ